MTKHGKAERRVKCPDYTLTVHFEGRDPHIMDMVIGDKFNVSFTDTPDGENKIRLELLSETDVLITLRFDSGRLMYLLLERKNG